jgi:hypothetical protein
MAKHATWESDHSKKEHGATKTSAVMLLILEKLLHVDNISDDYLLIKHPLENQIQIINRRTFSI